MQTVGNKLKYLIKKNRILHKDFASAAGLSASRLSNYIRGRRAPDLCLLTHMAKVLNVDLNFFTDEEFDLDYQFYKTSAAPSPSLENAIPCV